jgi:hypothetical protein
MEVKRPKEDSVIFSNQADPGTGSKEYHERYVPLRGSITEDRLRISAECFMPPH